MKKTLEQIGQGGPGIPGAAPDWLKGITDAAEAVKGTLQMGKEILELERSGNIKGALGKAAEPGGQWGKFLKKLIDRGYGDVPIGKMITELAPYTIKQLIELARMQEANDAGSEK